MEGMIALPAPEGMLWYLSWYVGTLQWSSPTLRPAPHRSAILPKSDTVDGEKGLKLRWQQFIALYTISDALIFVSGAKSSGLSDLSLSFSSGDENS